MRQSTSTHGRCKNGFNSGMQDGSRDWYSIFAGLISELVGFVGQANLRRYCRALSGTAPIPLSAPAGLR